MKKKNIEKKDFLTELERMLSIRRVLRAKIEAKIAMLKIMKDRGKNVNNK